MSRGIALYRMSTDKQDLITQQRVCKEYCIKNNIEIVDEYFEEDVSGYKTQLKDREELMKILQRAEKDRDFDVLVVYMKDRIIRRQDEAPIVLSVLKNSDIVCVEAKSGDIIKNENLTDDLMNYLSFWMAEFESAKTSMRVKDALKTKNQNNMYAGGKPPLGYRLYETDVISKKGRKLKEICVDEKEATIVKLIFDMCVNQNMGSLLIADELNKLGYKNRPKTVKNKDNPNIIQQEEVFFRQSTIIRLLKNPIYIGKRRYNTVQTSRDKSTLLGIDDWQLQDYREDLRIIDDETFYRAQELMQKRKVEKNNFTSAPSKSNVLCSGLAFCQCGAKLHVSYSVQKNKRKDGTIREYVSYRYTCRDGRNFNKNHREVYGKTYYSAKKYDDLVAKYLIRYINNLDKDKYEQLKTENEKNNIEKIKIDIDLLKKEKEKCYKNINKFESSLDSDIENSDIYIKGIRRNQERARDIEKTLNELEKKLNESISDNHGYTQFYNNAKSAVEILQGDDLVKKKAILGQIVNKIVFKDNGVKIELKPVVRESLCETDTIPTGKDINTHNIFIVIAEFVH